GPVLTLVARSVHCHAARPGQVDKEDLVGDLANNLVAVSTPAARTEALAEARHMRQYAEGLTDVVGLEERAVMRKDESVRARHVRNIVSAGIAVDGNRRLATKALVVDEHRRREDARRRRRRARVAA